MEIHRNMCRCCMNQYTDMIPIFHKMEMGGNMNLKELLLLAVPQLKISQDDKLPKHICGFCEQEVRNINKFQEQCLKTEAELHKICMDDHGIIGTVWIPDAIKLEFSNTFEHQELSNNTDLESCSESAIDMPSNPATDSENVGNGIKELNVKIVDMDEMQVNSCKEQEKVGKIKSCINNSIGSCSESAIDMPSNPATDSKNVGNGIKELNVKIVDMDEMQVNNCKEQEKVGRIKSCTNNSINMTWSNDKANKGIVSDDNRKKNKRKKNEINTCEKCGKMYTSKPNLASKQLADDPKKLICNSCKKAVSLIDNKPFVCPICGKRFISSYLMSRHRHSKETQFTCAHCPKHFKTKANLNSHLISHKVNVKSHICDECGLVFVRQVLLKQHKMYHSKEKNFICDFCQKRCYTKEKLQRHQRIHTGEKPYKCTFCENAYAQSNDLIKHFRIHLGENIYQCKLCPLRFPYVKAVREHFNSHINDDEQTRKKLMDEHDALDVKGLNWR